MSSHLTRALDNLRDKLIAGASFCENQLHLALSAHAERDTVTAQTVIDQDSVLDEMEVEIEEECLKILALHHPLSSDLRYIVSSLKMNNDLERIGDNAVNIARRTISLQNLPDEVPPFDVKAMGKIAQRMLKSSLDSLIATDVKIAEDVLRLDEKLDHFHRENYKRVSRSIQQSPENVAFYLEFLSLSRYLERAGDLCTNIAEDVIYLVEGKIVRHSHFS